MGGKGGRTTTTQSVDPDFKERALDVYDRAQAFSDQPFRPYTGQRVADFSQQEVAGGNAVNRFAGAAQPAIDAGLATTASIANDGGAGEAIRMMRSAGISPALMEAQGLARAAKPTAALMDGQDIVRTAGPTAALLQGQDMTRAAGATEALRSGQASLANATGFTPDRIFGGINTYMNPYTQSVVDTTLADIERSRQIAQTRNAAQAIGANAYGGSRQAIQASETDRAALEQAARTAAALRQSGFNTAAELSGRDIAASQAAANTRLAAGQALGQLGATEQNLALSQAGQLGQLGAVEQQARLSQGMGLGQLGASETGLLQSQASLLGQLGATETQLRQSQAESMGRLGLANQGQRLNAARQMGDLGVMGQSAGLQGAQALFGSGGLQRAQDQANLDAERDIFMEPQRDELMKLQVLQGALGMFPNPVMTSQTQNPGFLGTLGGLGQTGAQAALAYRLLALPIPGCWVAREVYGLHNPRWLMFREWLFEDAPRWFRRLYLRHGAAFAEWIADKPRLKAAIRRLMDSRIAAKFGGVR